jgi:hypothetical protein
MEKEAINRAIRLATGVDRDDFDSDLNAMHEVEKTLIETHRGYYNNELFKIASGRSCSAGVKEPDFIFLTINATAHQRCEAFLKVKGLWKD